MFSSRVRIGTAPTGSRRRAFPSFLWGHGETRGEYRCRSERCQGRSGRSEHRVMMRGSRSLGRSSSQRLAVDGS